MNGSFAVRRGRLVAAWAGIGVLAFAWAAVAQEPAGKKVLAKTFDLDNIWPGYDGQWQGIYAASDGNCYFACCSHSPDHGAGFFRYDPRTKQMKVLTEDISRTVGEDPAKTTPQGKIHSDIVEADGWLYFATHMAADQQGRVYLIASWFVLPGEEGCIKGNQGGKRMEWRMMFGVIEPAQGR